MEEYGDIYYVDSRNAVSRHYDPRPAQRRPYVPGGRVPTQTYYMRPDPRQQWMQGPPQSTAARTRSGWSAAVMHEARPPQS